MVDATAAQTAELRICTEFPIGEARVKGGNSGRKVLVVHGGDDQYYAMVILSPSIMD